MRKLLFFLMCMALFGKTAWPGPPETAPALQGLTSVRLICDVTVGDPELLLNRMALLDDTYTQLLDAGLTPKVVVAFRGEASRFTAKDGKYLPPAQRRHQADMKEWLKHFKALGFGIEQCAVAAKARNIDTKDVLPQVTVVANGYVSLIGYQNQGYALLPMD